MAVVIEDRSLPTADAEISAAVERLIASLPAAGDFDGWPSLCGRQDPWHHSAFDGSDVRGQKAELLGHRIGIDLMPWQRDTVYEWLRTRPDGKWVHPSCCLIVPRQNGKSEALLLRCIYGLFALGEKIIFTTQRWETAKELGERMIAMINDRPSLKKRLAAKPTKSQGRVVVELKSGAKISFATRSNDAGRGFTKVDLIVYDEAYNLTSGQRSALGWTQMASDNTQKIYTSSAVDELEHPNGHALAGIRRRGLDGGRGLAFREYMAPPELQWDSLAAARFANPSYGVIQTDEKIRDALDEVTSVKDQRGYEVEGLGRGRWPEDPDKRESEIPESLWTEKLTAPDDSDETVFVGSIALSVDRSYDGRVWSIALAQHTATERLHVEIGWRGTASNAEMVSMLLRVIEALDPIALVIDRKSAAAVLIPLLIAEGIEPVVTGAAQMGVACQGFVDDALDEILSVSGPDEHGVDVLWDAVRGASKRIMPLGDWAWDRGDGAIIAPLVAATLARWALLEYGLAPPSGALPEVPAGGDSDLGDDDMWSPDDDFDAMTATF